MNKNELVLAIAEKTGCYKAVAEKFVNSFVDVVAETLAEGEKIQLVGFGTFEVRKRNGRSARNPQTGERMWIEPATVPAFKAGKALKDAVNS